MPEEKIVLTLSRQSVELLHRLVLNQCQEAGAGLERGISTENQSLISDSEADLRCLDPIERTLEAALKRSE